MRRTITLLAVLLGCGTVLADVPKKLLLVGQGPECHPPATHEYMDGLKVLEKLFPEPFKKIGEIKANEVNWGRASKYKILDLIAAEKDPKQRRVIIETYDALFSATKNEDPWFTAALKETVVSGKPAEEKETAPSGAGAQ